MRDLPRLKLSLLMQFSLLGLLITAAIALVVTWGIQRQLERNALRQVVESAANQVATILNPNLSPDDLAGPPTPPRFEHLDALMRRTVLHTPIVRVKIWGRDGVLLYSDEQELVGRRFPLSDDLQEAFAGKIAMDISSLEKEENVYERQHFSRLFEVYVPLRPMNAPEIAGAYEIYYDTAGLEPGLAGMRQFVWASVGLGFLGLYGALFTLVRRASHELMRRNEENARLYHEAKAQLAERQRAEAALRQSEKLAMMGQLLAGVAHELNNPLSVMMGQTALLRRLTGPGEVGERAEKIAQAALRCTRIVRNFLAMARQHPPERQVVAFHQIIAEALELLAYPLRIDSVECDLHLADNLPMLWADPHQLHQVVVNLVANAHHAMRDRLTIEEMAQLGAQLPLLIRGVYYEGWDPTGQPHTARVSS